MPTYRLTALTVQFGPDLGAPPLDATSFGNVVITSSEGLPKAFYTNGEIDPERARTDGAFTGDIDTISFNGTQVDPATLIASRVTLFYGPDGSRATNLLTLLDPASNIEALIYLQDDPLPAISGAAQYDLLTDAIVQFSVTDRGDYRADRPIFFDDLPGVSISDIAIVPGGTPQGDRLFGGARDDRFVTGGGDDTVGGLGGNDLIDAGDGNDVIDGGAEADRLLGGAGRDTLRGQSGEDTLDGGIGNDVLDGGDDRDEFYGGAGNDLIVGGSGNDQLRGGPGDDTIRGGEGTRDRLFYQDAPAGVSVNFATGIALDGTGGRDEISGIERLTGSAFDDTIIGTGGNQYLTPDQGDDIVDGGPGDGDEVSYRNATGAITANLALGLSTGADGQDRLTGIEALVGSTFGDVLTGDTNDNQLNGFDGDDTLFGGAGDDTLEGNVGDDVLNGGPGSDLIVVDSAGDVVVESARWEGTDKVLARTDFRMGRSHIEDLELIGDARLGAGNGLANVILGNANDNVLDGGRNNDTLIGGGGDDRYFIRAPGDRVVEQADRGVDVVLAYRSYALDANVESLFMQTVYTRDGDPSIFNGIGNVLDNTIVGTPFANFVIGREGSDTLKGQAGADTFVFDRAIGPANVDRIIDFNANEAAEGDRLLMKGSVFGGLAAGVVSAADFAAGRTAGDATDRFIFDQGSGRLWFDSDGTGRADQVLIATFDQNATLSAQQIEIF